MSRSVSEDIQRTAAERRLLAIRCLGREFDRSDPTSFVSRLGHMIRNGPPRPMIVSADIDGLVSAAMLGSVAPGWKVVAFLVESDRLMLHRSVLQGRPDDLFGVDVFSPAFDNVGNHVVLFGSAQYRQPLVRQAFNNWDAMVQSAAAHRLMGSPSIWAQTQACYEDAAHPTSAKYKYPLGTAQLMLALLEAGGFQPRLFDREYLPWLVANCDGGIDTFYGHAYNAAIWWQAMAGAVGPGSHTEQICQRLYSMRLHDFRDAVNRLDRERRSEGQEAWLNDKWNLSNTQPSTIARTIQWLESISGWPDPVEGGAAGLEDWGVVPIAAADKGLIYFGSSRTTPGASGASISARANPAQAAASIQRAARALNANFYLGGTSGSRFNWVGGSGW